MLVCKYLNDFSQKLSVNLHHIHTSFPLSELTILAL